MKSFILSLWIFCAGYLLAQPLPLSVDYWKDPVFLKSFNGSYRIEARIEPSVTSEERDVLLQMQAMMSQGKRKEALEKLRTHPLTASSTALTFNLANLYFETGETDAAISSFQKAIKDYPSFRRAHRNLAIALIQKNQSGEALTHLAEALRLGDAEGTTYGLLGFCRIQQKEFASALQAYRMAGLTEPDVAEWKAGIAQCLQEMGDMEEAILLMQEVVAKRPKEAAYAVYLAQLQLADDQRDEAQKTLELPHRIGILSADATLLLAELHLQAQRTEEAQTLTHQAFAKKDPPSIAAIQNLIQKALLQNEWAFAKSLITKAKTYQESALLQRVEARYLIASEEDPSAGAKILEELIAKDPTDAASLFALGQYQIEKQELHSAELLLERASKDPAHAYNAFIELAKLRVQQSRFRKALESIDSAAKIQTSESLETYRKAVKAAAEAAE